MPTYATAADVKTYTEVSSLDALTDPQIDALIEKAERDIDNAVGVHDVNPDTGLKFTPLTLETRDVDSLMRATCAQAEYRHVMGAEFFIRPQYESVNGPEFSTNGKLPIVGPETWKELENGGLLRLTTSWAKSGGSAPPWADFAYNLNSDDADDPPSRGTIRTPS